MWETLFVNIFIVKLVFIDFCQKKDEFNNIENLLNINNIFYIQNYIYILKIYDDIQGPSYNPIQGINWTKMSFGGPEPKK